MAAKFPIFFDISNKKIYVYGAGRIASRRIKTLLPFGPIITVVALEASEEIRRASEAGQLFWKQGSYAPGTIESDVWMVLAATNDASVNEAVCRECRRKGILVNVCSDQRLCDFQFPGIASKGDLTIGINAGGHDHSLAKRWTDKIRKEVEEDGYDNQAKKASDVSKAP